MPAMTAKSGASAAIPWSRYLVFFLLAQGGLLADLISKELVFRWRGLPGEKPVWWIIEGYFGIETALNRGALFGFGQGHSWFFASMSVVAAVAIVVWLFYFKMAQDAWLNFALGCVMAGIFGNLYDRLGLWNHGVVPPEFETAVRDWILWSVPGQGGLIRWPNFNIADSLLVFAAGMLIVHSFWRGEEKRADAAA
jgi:signal peptidase II